MLVSVLSSPFVCAHVTNGLSHPYHLDESTFSFRGIGNIIFISISFFDEIHVSKQNSPRWNAAFCLCPIKRTQGLYGLRLLSDSLLGKTYLSNDERKYGHQFSIDFSQYFA